MTPGRVFQAWGCPKNSPCQEAQPDLGVDLLGMVEGWPLPGAGDFAVFGAFHYGVEILDAF